MSFEHVDLQVRMEFESYMHNEIARIEAQIFARAAFCRARTAEDHRRLGAWKWGDGAKRLEAKRSAQKQCSCARLGKRGKAVCGFCVYRRMKKDLAIAV